MKISINQTSGDNSIQIGIAKNVRIELPSLIEKREVKSFDKILFYQGDFEILDNIGVLKNENIFQHVYDLMVLELRLLILAMPPESCIVIPPTYYLESYLTRKLLKSHEIFIDHGFIKLLCEFTNIEDYLIVKKDRYKKAAHFSHYHSAYFSNTDYGLKDLNFQIKSKNNSIGLNTLEGWSNSISNIAKLINYSSKKIVELKKRVIETEKPAFLYENLIEHMERVGIDYIDSKRLHLREIKNYNYLDSYLKQEILIPTGSRIVNDVIVPKESSYEFNIEAWLRIFEFIKAIEFIKYSEPQKILELKSNIEFATIISSVRQRFIKGSTTDNIVSFLAEKKLINKFQKLFHN